MFLDELECTSHTPSTWLRNGPTPLLMCRLLRSSEHREAPTRLEYAENLGELGSMTCPRMRPTSWEGSATKVSQLPTLFVSLAYPNNPRAN